MAEIANPDKSRNPDLEIDYAKAFDEATKNPLTKEALQELREMVLGQYLSYFIIFGNSPDGFIAVYYALLCMNDIQMNKNNKNEQIVFRKVTVGSTNMVFSVTAFTTEQFQSGLKALIQIKATTLVFYLIACLIK